MRQIRVDCRTDHARVPIRFSLLVGPIYASESASAHRCSAAPVRKLSATIVRLIVLAA